MSCPTPVSCRDEMLVTSSINYALNYQLFDFISLYMLGISIHPSPKIPAWIFRCQELR